MIRRTFLRAAAAAPVAFGASLHEDLPKYRVASRFQPSAHPGMPGLYPGKVAKVHAEKSIDSNSEKVDVPTVREMISQGMRALTGDKDARDSWARFFAPADVVGIKVNCSGAPDIMSTPEIIVFQLLPNLLPYLAATFVAAVSATILASIGLEVLD